MIDARAFRGFRFPAEVVLWAVRWYLRFPVSYRDLELMLADRGVEADHTTLYRWVQRFAPELEKRMRRPLRPWPPSLSVFSRDLAAPVPAGAALSRAVFSSSRARSRRQAVCGRAVVVSVASSASSLRPAPRAFEMQFSMSECSDADNFCPDTDNADRC